MLRASSPGRAVSVVVASAVASAVAILVAVLGPGACRVGPQVADALIAPFPDSAATDLAPDGDGPSAPCDLLAQNCPNQKTCYPVDGVPGATSCEFTGSAPPTTVCVMSLECDRGEACVLVAESQTTMCAILCDPSAVQTGCQGAAPCRLLPGHRVGFCVP